MVDMAHRFDVFWSTFNADELKRMSVVWGAPNTLRKEERITYLIAAPKDPEKVDAALERMLPFERAVLGLLRWMGGTADIRALSVAIRATGLTPTSGQYTGDYGVRALSDGLLNRGIVMPEGGNRNYGFGYSTERRPVFADERVLARVPPVGNRRTPTSWR